MYLRPIRLFISVFVVFVLTLTGAAQSDVLGPNITFAVKSGKVYSQKNPFDQWYPASITKMMTAYVAFREIEIGHVSMQSPVRISPNSLSKPPSKMGFPVGTILTLESALKIILVKSANDVASAIAESVGGSEAGFSTLMNKYARQIGMVSSNFVNPHGLHNVAQYTSAYDMALLARDIYRRFPQYSNLFGIQAIKVGKRTFRNHNALMRHFPGTIGMKTGFICAGGLNVVTASRYNGDIIVSVVMGGQSGKERNILAAQLQQVARNAIGTDRLPDLTSLKMPKFPSPPIDISESVCGKKRRKGEVFMYNDEAIEYYAIKRDPLEIREKRYLTSEPIKYTAETVKLGGATGPDPFELLVEKPPIKLTEEFAFGSGEEEPEERFELKSGKIIAIPKFSPRALPTAEKAVNPVN